MSMNFNAFMTTPELGVIVIGLNAFTPLDHVAEHAALRERLTLAYMKRDPEAYAKMVARGDIEPVDTPETVRAKAVLAAAGQPVA